MKRNEDMFDIYQIKPGTSFRDYGFENSESLKARGLKVEYANYEFKYSDFLKKGMTLENIYMKFNIERPEDFKGHSLSVSDVVVLVKEGETTAHFVDSFGFKEVPEFLIEREETRKSKTSVLSELKANRLKVDKVKSNKEKAKNNGLDER